MFCLFLHWVLLEAFNDNAFGHEGGDFVFEVGLALIGKGVHLLDAFLEVI